MNLCRYWSLARRTMGNATNTTFKEQLLIAVEIVVLAEQLTADAMMSLLSFHKSLPLAYYLDDNDRLREATRFFLVIVDFFEGQ